MLESLGYSMFRYGFQSVAVDELSEIVMRLCMDDEDAGCGQFEDECRDMISCMVTALHSRRVIEAQLENDEDDGHTVPTESRPEEYFIARYEKLGKRHKITLADGDACWESWWPIKCPWHKTELNRLASLNMGETIATRMAWAAAIKNYTTEVTDD